MRAGHPAECSAGAVTTDCSSIRGGLALTQFKDESLAPEVDHDLLRALVRHELDEPTARSVYEFIYSFKSWNEAHTEILSDEFRRNHGEAREKPDGGQD